MICRKWEVIQGIWKFCHPCISVSQIDYYLLRALSKADERAAGARSREVGICGPCTSAKAVVRASMKTKCPTSRSEIGQW
jgi:hypothetical protein